MADKPEWMIGHGIDDAEEAAQEAIEAYENRVDRVYLKAGEERQFVFLDDDPVVYREHNVPTLNKNGYKSWRNWTTCSGKGCPLCAKGDLPYTAAAYTVIDVDGYVKRDGTKVTKVKKLLVAKPQTAQKLARLSRKLRQKGAENGLAGHLVTVYRSTPQSPSVGDDFTVEGLAKGDFDREPFDYAKVLAPNREMARRLATIGLFNSSDGPAAAADSPVEDDEDGTITL
jgi:hypothetical protein